VASNIQNGGSAKVMSLKRDSNLLQKTSQDGGAIFLFKKLCWHLLHLSEFDQNLLLSHASFLHTKRHSAGRPAFCKKQMGGSLSHGQPTIEEPYMFICCLKPGL